MSDEYGFQPYLDAIRGNWFEDDETLQASARRHLGAEAAELSGTFRDLGRRTATDWAELAEASEFPNALPAIAARDAHGTRTESVTLPETTRRLMAEVYAALGRWDRGPEIARFIKTYLLAQNGEAGVTCSVACTDGLHRLLAKLGKDPRSRKLIEELNAPAGGGFRHGAQFVTEMHAGSDAGACRTVARPAHGQGQEGLWRLHGEKFFCSNLTADYWALTARPEGAQAGHRGVGLFVLPRLDEDGRPNGHRVLRLKDKLGTRALPTGEIDFEGALGWPVGPLDKGIANMVGVVLTTSRVYTSLGSAALLRGATRQVEAYTRFRTAFGKPIAELPGPADTLRRIHAASDRTTAGCFEVLARWLAAQGDGAKPEEKLEVRVLIQLMKPAATRAANRWIHEAMLLMGGNGIEERFSPVPRLYRDSVIYETWEGPHLLLYAQCLDDMLRFELGSRAHEWVDRVLGDTPGRRELGEELHQILLRPQDPATPGRFIEWGARFYAAFEEKALGKLGEAIASGSDLGS